MHGEGYVQAQKTEYCTALRPAMGEAAAHYSSHQSITNHDRQTAVRPAMNGASSDQSPVAKDQ